MAIRDRLGALPSRVLMLHNRYQQSGGEDVVVEQEAKLLRDRGHELMVLERDNAEIRADKLEGKARLFGQTLWSAASYRETVEAIRAFRPAVVHVHNYLPLLSPSVYHAAWSEGVPVVQTLHNYRLICPGSLLMRNGRICEDCVGHRTWRGAWHACYRSSHLASTTIVAMIESHRVLGTWRRVEAYIALSEFHRQKLIAGGLPADRLYLKPNFVAWHSPVRSGPGEYALYAGRLSAEKGVKTLVRAWARAGCEGAAGLALKLVGSGPLENELKQVVAATGARVELLGLRTHAEVADLLRGARYVVYPSELYEPNGITLIEAFAAGVPIIASRIGSLEEFVDDGQTGLHFEAGDAADLLRAASRLGGDAAASVRMGVAARAVYLSRHTPEKNYEQLLNVYSAAAQRVPSGRN